MLNLRPAVVEPLLPTLCPLPPPPGPLRALPPPPRPPPPCRQLSLERRNQCIHRKVPPGPNSGQWFSGQGAMLAGRGSVDRNYVQSLLLPMTTGTRAVCVVCLCSNPLAACAVGPAGCTQWRGEGVLDQSHKGLPSCELRWPTSRGLKGCHT